MLRGLALSLIWLLASASANAITIAECRARINALLIAVENDANFTSKRRAKKDMQQVTKKLSSAREKLYIEEFWAAVTHVQVAKKRSLHFLKKGQLDLGIPPDTTPPTSVSISAPATALAGQTIHVTASAVDDVGVHKVTFFADGVPFSEDTDAPYETDYSIAGNKPEGSQTVFVAQATVFSTNSTDSAMAFTEIVPPGEGFVVGEVYDDSTGQPIEGVSVMVRQAGGEALSLSEIILTDDRGRFSVSLPEGAAVIESSQDGFTHAYRTFNVLPNEVNFPLDGRLTPLADTMQINPLAGTTIGTTEDDIQLEVPSGAFADAVSLSLTQLSGQGLPSPLPLGWSPVLAVNIGPHYQQPNVPLNLIINRALDPNAIAAMWHSTSREWIRIESNQNGTQSVNVSQMGAFAFVRPDTQPQAPVVPEIGNALAGVLPVAIPDAVPAQILPSPRIIFMQPSDKSDVSVQLQPAGPLPSGTKLEVHFSETYDRTNNTVLSPEHMTQDYLLYQGQSGSSAEFIASPSVFFDPFLLREGVIHLDAFSPRGNDGTAIVSALGGIVTAQGGINVEFPPDALSDTTPIQISALDQIDDALSGDSRFNFLAGADLDFNGQILFIPATTSFQLAAPLVAGTQLLAVMPRDIGGITRYQLVGLGTVDTNAVTINDGGTGLPLPGITRGGRLFLLQMNEPIGFATGLVDANAPPLTSVVVSNDSLPFISLPNLVDTLYALPASIGDFALNAQDIADGRSASSFAAINTENEIINVDLILNPTAPTVASITPADGATNVALTSPVTVRFSQAMDATTINDSTFTLNDGTTSVQGTVTLQPDSITAVFRSTEPLADSKTYGVTLTSSILGAYGQALAGNQADGSFAVSFDTVDVTPPP